MNSGIFIPILEKTRLDYTYLAAGATQTLRLRSNIEVIPYHYAQLYVRVHTRSMTSGQTLRFALFNSLPSPEDSREFLETASFLGVDVTPTSPTVPGVLSASASGPGPYLAFAVTITQGSASSTLIVDVSADLLLRTG